MQMALLCLYMQLLQLLRIAINCCGETELNCSSLRATTTTTVRDKTVEMVEGGVNCRRQGWVWQIVLSERILQSINYYYYFICK